MSHQTVMSTCLIKCLANNAHQRITQCQFLFFLQLFFTQEKRLLYIFAGQRGREFLRYYMQWCWSEFNLMTKLLKACKTFFLLSNFRTFFSYPSVTLLRTMWTPMKYHLYTMEAKKNLIKVYLQSLHFFFTITIVAVVDLMIFMSFV